MNLLLEIWSLNWLYKESMYDMEIIRYVMNLEGFYSLLDGREIINIGVDFLIKVSFCLNNMGKFYKEEGL